MLKKPGGATVNCGEITVGGLSPGTTVTKTLTLPVIGASWPKGVYDLRIDLKNANGWFRDQAIPWRSLNYKPCVGSNSCSENYLPLIMKDWDNCVERTTYWYPTGANSCHPTTTTISGCDNGSGGQDGNWAGPWNTDGYHQILFTPQRVLTNTKLHAYWQTAPGATGNGDLYIDANLNNVWIRLRTSSFQSQAAPGRWEPPMSAEQINMAPYAGQYISGLRFGFSNRYGHQFMVDGYRIINFKYCGE